MVPISSIVDALVSVVLLLIDHDGFASAKEAIGLLLRGVFGATNATDEPPSAAAVKDARAKDLMLTISAIYNIEVELRKCGQWHAGLPLHS